MMVCVTKNNAEIDFFSLLGSSMTTSVYYGKLGD